MTFNLIGHDAGQKFQRIPLYYSKEPRFFFFCQCGKRGDQ